MIIVLWIEKRETMGIIIWINILMEGILDSIIINILNEIIIKYELNENGLSIFEIINISNEILDEYNNIISFYILIEYISIFTIILAIY